MKITDHLLEQYLELEKELATMMEEFREKAEDLEAIRVILKEKGSLSTRNHVVVVSEVSRDHLPGIKEMTEALGKKVIDPLIKTSKYLTVKVQKKSSLRRSK